MISKITNGYSSLNYYKSLSSGKKINSAKDNASGLAIANKLQSQEKGLNVGAENSKQGSNMLNVADGALNSIGDSLQRIYELSVKASNGLYSNDDKNAFQKEIDGLLDNIKNVSTNTEFNTMKILDGSIATMELATNPSGNRMKIQMQNATLESLSIDGYDVTTKDFDISRITNALESTYNSNKINEENTVSSRSQLEDLDYMSSFSNFKKSQVLDSFKLMLQNQQQNDEQKITQQLFSPSI